MAPRRRSERAARRRRRPARRVAGANTAWLRASTSTCACCASGWPRRPPLHHLQRTTTTRCRRSIRSTRWRRARRGSSRRRARRGARVVSGAGEFRGGQSIPPSCNPSFALGQPRRVAARRPTWCSSASTQPTRWHAHLARDGPRSTRSTTTQRLRRLDTREPSPEAVRSSGGADGSFSEGQPSPSSTETSEERRRRRRRAEDGAGSVTESGAGPTRSIQAKRATMAGGMGDSRGARIGGSDRREDRARPPEARRLRVPPPTRPSRRRRRGRRCDA